MVVVAAAGLAACGGDPCSQQSKCSGDPKLTETDIQNCRDATKDGAKCAKEQKAALQCSIDKATCTANGVTDGNKLAMDCATQFNALTTCLTTP